LNDIIEELEKAIDFASSLNLTEKKIIYFLLFGFTKKEVAYILELSPQQLKTHLKHIRKKFKDIYNS